MIINSKAVSLTEAATMLGKSEQEVLQLVQYGYLEQSKPNNGNTRISIRSMDTYTRRSGITLHEATKPVVARSGSFTIVETMTKLGLRTEDAVHRLIQSGRLHAFMENGTYKVSADSVRNYILNE